MTAPEPVLRVENLGATASGRCLLDGVSFTVAAGRVLAIVGASGSGKTTTGRALLGEAGPGVRLTGEVEIAGRRVGPGQPPPPGTVGYVPQQPAAALNPVRRIGPVLHAVARRHSGSDVGWWARRIAARQTVEAVLARVCLPADRATLRRFPHQLSGGQQQRLVIAHALLSRARVLVADEPTTGQDTVNRREVAAELRELARTGLAVVLLSHDLDLVRSLADQVLVLRHGSIVEAGPPALLRLDHARPLTRPARDNQAQDNRARPSTAPAQRKRSRESPAGPAERAPVGVPLLSVAGLHARHGSGPGQRSVLHDVDLTLDTGECLAVVGRSGSGKTTLARCVVGLHPPSGGEVRLSGQLLAAHLGRRSRTELAQVQYVWQDPRASFQPHRSVLDQCARAAVRLRGCSPTAARAAAVALLERVGLPEPIVGRHPGLLSGGELQRAALSRALLTGPRVLVCDEITAGLDADIRDEILGLLDRLRRDLGLALVVVTHDPAVVDRVADRVVVLDDGEVVEEGPASVLLTAARQPLTRALLARLDDAASQRRDPRRETARTDRRAGLRPEH